jgi:5-hydroxyisourate hydrolase
VTTVSTHVLDTVTGRPAAGVAVELQARHGDAWQPLGAGTTSADGRVAALAGPDGTEPGVHRLVFDTGPYLRDTGEAFFPEVAVTFEITTEQHLHVPLLLSRFGYSVYKGS